MRLSYTPPPGWDFATVGDLAKPEKGSIRIGPFGSALKKHEYSENGIRVLGIEDVHPNQFLSDRCKYIPDAKFCELRQYEVSDGDVLVTNMGTVGRACAVPAGTQRSIISSHLIKVSLNRSRADPTYLCWMLNYSPLVVAQIRAKSHGAIMAGFNSSLLKSLQIPLPPLAEQKRIAGILDAADALRAKRREAFAQLDTLLQSTFLDMFGDPVTNPKGWNVVAFESIGNSRLEKMLDKGKEVGDRQFPYLANTNVQWGRFDLTALRTMDFSESDCEEFKLEDGDLLICEGGEVGRTAIWHGAHNRIYFQKALHRVRLDPTVAVPEYVFQFMWFMAKNGGFRDLTTSATIAHLAGVKLKRLPCPRPPLKLQHRYAVIVKSVEQQKTSQRAHLADLDTLFASLQSRAFRGDL